jgi:uncharacterized RDD family membrane protein YckC
MENISLLDGKEQTSIYNVHEKNVQFDRSLLPSLVVRIKALFIDLVILLLVFTMVSIVVDAVGSVPSIIKGIIAVFMFYLYDPIFTAFYGGTIGHKIMRLKIKRFQEPDKNISLAAALLRFLMKSMLGWISFFTVTGNINKRAIHDLVSGSILLRSLPRQHSA